MRYNINVTTFSQALQEARSIMDRGAFREAFDRIADVPVNRPDELFAKIALMADTGIALRDASVLEYGLYLLEHHSGDILDVPSFAPFYWLNTANLRCNLLAVRESEGEKRCYYQRKQSARARQAYSKAFSCAADDKPLKVLILCAHARLLTGLGRDWEAFELFDKAVRLNPEDEEALLGRAETLAAIAGTAPALEEDLCREALDNLRRLLESEDGALLRDTVEPLLQSLRERLGGDAEPPDYPRNTVFSNSDREHEMITFSLKHHLYLSPYAVCRNCDRAIGDAAALGAQHASLGSLSKGRYRKMAMLTGRITERYRVLRAALVDHHRNTDLPDGSDFQPHFPELEGWQPLPPASAAFAAALAGTPALMEGMAACVAAYLGRETKGPVRVDHILGSPAAAGAALKTVENPALHAFWDLWADGMDGMVDGVELISLFGSSLSVENVSAISLNAEELTEKGAGLLGWLRNLLGYLIRMADREGRGETGTPPLWPLQPFVLPGKMRG